MNIRIILCFVVVISVPRLVLAHDFWLEPEGFHVPLGKEVGISFVVGEKFRGKGVARNPYKLKRFIVLGAEGEKEVAGVDFKEPAGTFIASEGGVHVIGYQNRPSSVRLSAEKFKSYVAHEGLSEFIGDLEIGKQGVLEFFSRSAKTVVCVEDCKNSSLLQKPLGLNIELLPARDPFRGGAHLPVELLLRGEPLANALVVVRSKSNPMSLFQKRTDAEGRVHIPLEAGETYLVKAVFIEPAGVRRGDLYSYWASLTFQTSRYVQ